MHVSRSDLLARGWTDGRIARDVRDGLLVRIRAGHFATAPMDDLTMRAIHVGGRLACVSQLRRRGVWVLGTTEVHVHLAANASRLRADPIGSRGHWRPLVRAQSMDDDQVSLIDALLQAHECLPLPAWIASIDSSLHLRLLQRNDLAALRTHLPRSAHWALELVDANAESGLESIVRVIARLLGLRVRSQVAVPGIGRVDLVIEEWIVVETDGSAFHDTALAPRDRRRDAGLAARGRTVLRPGYELVVHDQAAVAQQLIGAVETHRRVQHSGQLAARARGRLHKLGLA